LQADAEALLFSAKTFGAAMLAYYLALRIGLPRPYWAILTAYIVSQTSAAASLSRGVYRFAGTLVGAVATVAIVPHFVNEPAACSLALACWIGLCMYCSLLDRTPRAYAFVLAGYTASLIGFPSVSDPGAVFDTASLRVQEITLGILCAVLTHRFILPSRMTGQFIGKLAATLRDAHRLAGVAVHGMPAQETRQDRQQLAVDLLALQGLTPHLPYDPVPSTPHRKELQRMHDRLARLLPLSSGIEDRVHALGTRPQEMPGELSALLAEVAAWHATMDAQVRDAAALPLIERARRCHAAMDAQAPAIDLTMAAGLAGDLADMVGLLHDCDRLARRIANPGPSHTPLHLHWPAPRTGYVYHRDTLMSLRAALGAIAGICTACAFWIWSAWPDGATAVSLVGVCCALFGNVDSPAPNVLKYMKGSLYGVAASLAYGFAVLPRVTDFAVLVAVLAPVLLFAGSLQARPQTAFMALGVTLTVPILAGLGASYGGDFAESLNSSIALFAATGFAAVSMALFQSVPVDVAIDRLLRLSRNDIRRRALAGGGDEAYWTGLMVDRTALQAARLRLSGRPRSDLLDDMVRQLRIGHAAGALRRAVRPGNDDFPREASAILMALADAFGTRKPPMPATITGIVARIDRLAAAITSRTGAMPRPQDVPPELLLNLRLALVAGGTGPVEPTP
jgi:uncharacterized membrane protein YccC